MNTTNRLPKEHCNLVFDKEITRWDEAIPLGNGGMGCLIWGKSTALRLSLDRGDIWDKTVGAAVLAPDFTYAELVKLAHDGDTDEIRSRFDSPYYHTVPTKLPAGKIILNLGESSQIRSSLDLATATSSIEIVGTDKTVILNSFLHATSACGFVKIDLPLSDFSFHLENPEFGILDEGAMPDESRADCLNTASLKRLHYKAPVIFDDIMEKWFVQAIDTDFSYGIFLKACEKDGSTQLVYTIASSNDGADWQVKAQQRVTAQLSEGYDCNLATHTAWWEAYWNKSSITLPNEMFEKNWYLTNYLLASCSRKGCYPMPLQGVWTADDGTLPPWKGDYHHDLNTQMSYYSYLKANHMDEGESFVDFLWSLVPQARAFAKTFFNSDGLCLPAVMAIDGTALGGWPMYSLSPTNQLWLGQAFERHYRFTGDMEFLRTKAYVYCAESMACVLGIMHINEQGQYVLPVSSSSEIHDDSAQAWLTPNSNYDLALIRYATTQLVHFSRILDNKKEQYWQAVLEKLPPLAVNKYDILMLSPDESLLESHRHHSHAMSIHPLRLLDVQLPSDKKIIDATISNLELLGTGSWCGYSFPWMSEFYAVQGNGNGAAYQLEVFWKNCCSQNGFHLNGDYKNRGTSTFHYRPFTLEGNFCAADALQEMLLQTENNTVHLFPAIPEEWLSQTVQFEDFHGENGLLISACMENGKIVSLTLKPQHNGAVRVRNYNAISHLTSNIPYAFVPMDNDIELTLTAGSTITFTEKTVEENKHV